MDTIYDKTFLYSCFTTDEFDFIKHLNDYNQLLDQMLKKQQIYRDSVVKLMSILNSTASEKEKDLLSKAQHIFETINSNIYDLQSNMHTSDVIHKKLMNLLIQIESDNENVSESKYTDEINKLKTDLSNYIEKTEKVKNSIISNDNTISAFFDNNMVRYYLMDSSSVDDNNVVKNNTKENSQNDIELKDDDIKISENNYCLIISESLKRVFLPYTQKEVSKYLEKYPEQYTSFEDVVKKEFIYPIDYYLKHTVVSRFRETYSLIRDREAKSVLEAFKIAIDMMFHYDLNPAVIAACKSQEQLENYLECLKNQNLNNFKDFEIRFEISPLKK